MVKRVCSENIVWGKECPNTSLGLYYMLDNCKNEEDFFQDVLKCSLL